MRGFAKVRHVSDGSRPHVPSTRAVDVLVHLRTARFDRPLSYEVPDGVELAVGDVVRVPLASRQVFGYVVSAPFPPNGRALRPVSARADVPRAFDETGLALARYIARTSICTPQPPRSLTTRTG